ASVMPLSMENFRRAKKSRDTLFLAALADSAPKSANASRPLAESLSQNDASLSCIGRTLTFAHPSNTLPSLASHVRSARESSHLATHCRVRGIDYNGVRPSTGAAILACARALQLLDLTLLARCCARGRAHPGVCRFSGGAISQKFTQPEL